MENNHNECIPELKTQHREIMEYADKVLELASAHNPNIAPKIKNALDAFEDSLNNHIIFEDEHLYDVAIKVAASNEDEMEKITEFRAEMSRITQVVIDFLSRYDSSDKIAENIETFGKDFGKIFGILMLRIETEELSEYFTCRQK